MFIWSTRSKRDMNKTQFSSTEKKYQHMDLKSESIVNISPWLTFARAKDFFINLPGQSMAEVLQGNYKD